MVEIPCNNLYPPETEMPLNASSCRSEIPKTMRWLLLGKNPKKLLFTVQFYHNMRLIFGQNFRNNASLGMEKIKAIWLVGLQRIVVCNWHSFVGLFYIAILLI